MFFCQFHEKWISVRERNIKLLLESITYIAITETVACIYNRNSCALQKITLAIATEIPTCINRIKKIVTHLFNDETVTCIKCCRNF